MVLIKEQKRNEESVVLGTLDIRIFSTTKRVNLYLHFAQGTSFSLQRPTHVRKKFFHEKAGKYTESAEQQTSRPTCISHLPSLPALLDVIMSCALHA